MEQGKWAIAVISGLVGAMMGAFSMMLFVFNIMQDVTATVTKLDSHLSEWSGFRDRYDKDQSGNKELGSIRDELERLRRDKYGGK